MRVADGQLAFVYKTAAEIGELGDNTARLRAQIRDDDLLRIALRAESARTRRCSSHTRWASVGIISEANAHPLNQEELGSDGATVRSYTSPRSTATSTTTPTSRRSRRCGFRAEITTDAKVIPALVSRRIASGVDARRGVPLHRRVVRGIGRDRRAVAGATPISMLLALRGSGQALYVGLGDDCFVVASEPYGLVEECERYLRLDGETMLEAGNPAIQGQIVVLDARERGLGQRPRPPVVRRARAAASTRPSCRRRRSPRATSTAGAPRTTS